MGSGCAHLYPTWGHEVNVSRLLASLYINDLKVNILYVNKVRHQITVTLLLTTEKKAYRIINKNWECLMTKFKFVL